MITPARSGGLVVHFGERRNHSQVLDGIRAASSAALLAGTRSGREIWEFLQQNDLSDRIYATYEAIVDACCAAWNKLIASTRPHPLHRHARLGQNGQLMSRLVSFPRFDRFVLLPKAGAALAGCETQRSNHDAPPGRAGKMN